MEAQIPWHPGSSMHATVRLLPGVLCQYRYLRWVDTVLLSGEVKIDRALLLERCINAFHNYSQYTQDSRFVDLCIAYVRQLDSHAVELAFDCVLTD